MLGFIFRLARELKMTVKRLLAELAPGELDYWLAFAQLEPFGAHVEDLRAGIVASTIANCHLASDADPLSPADFIPKWHKTDEPPPTPDQLKTKILAAFGAMKFR